MKKDPLSEGIGDFLKNKRIIVISVLLIAAIAFAVMFFRAGRYPPDTVSYEGEQYVCLEYNMDIFTYNYNGSGDFVSDIIHPVPHDKWNMVYFNGDLFVHEDEVKDAAKYYADDSNYEWSFVLDYEDTEKEYPIDISPEELKYIYGMDNMKKEEAFLFDEIEKMASLKKTSRDGTVSSIICLAYHNNSWYWRTEIIDITKENDPEYMIKLPMSLNEKLNVLLNE